MNRFRTRTSFKRVQDRRTNKIQEQNTRLDFVTGDGGVDDKMCVLQLSKRREYYDCYYHRAKKISNYLPARYKLNVPFKFNKLMQYYLSRPKESSDEY